MWTRDELKLRAKAVLKVSYWKAFLVSLLLFFFCGGASGSESAGKAGANITSNDGVSMDFDSFSSGFSDIPELYSNNLIGFNTITVAGIATVTLVMLFLGIAFAIFVSGPLEVGCHRYFTSACCYQFNPSEVGMAFKSGSYLSVVWAVFYRNLFTFLWSLLFVIPGIVKSLAYSMIPYILADNPNIGAKRALQLSQDMTRGHKWDIFVLRLSFLGWYLLGTLACGVGTFFVHPYANSTYAELYMVLRHNALSNGMVSLNELCLE